jgi:hypothetical protein
MPQSMRRGAAFAAVALTTLGLAATAGASLQQLPPGAQVNDDRAAGIDPGRDAGVSDVVGGSLAAGGVRVPWAAFEQQTTGKQQIFVRAFKNGAWKTQGASLNIERNQDAEAPSIDFAGAGRTVPWTAWYEPNSHLPGGKTNIFASRFAAAQNTWIPEGQDRAPNSKVPSLNIHTNQEAENPALAGGAVTAGNDPVPWVAWQEKDGGDDTTATDQIFVSRGIKQTDCSANQPGGGTSVSAFCWQQTGLGRLAAASHDPGPDPTLNVDPTRNGIEPDIAFTGPNDTVPWVVWYETDDSGISGLHDNEMVFAAKAVNDGGGNFHWVTVGNRGSGILDSSGAHRFGPCAESADAEGDCSLNADPAKDAEDPRVASGTLTPGGVTSPWVAWAETTPSGKKGIFVSRLVGGTHFELANGGKPLSSPLADAEDPDITFSGNTPYVTWESGGNTVVGHFASLTSFRIDAVTPKTTGRSPISSSNTSDPFTKDGTVPQGDAVGTPFFLTLSDPAPHKLLAHGYRPDDVRTYPATDVTKTSARLHGSVNPAGAPVKVHFEYGPTTAYGSRTPDLRIAPGNAPVAFSADLAGLAPNTRVHYRTVAVSDFGTFYGPDQEFRTKTHHYYGLIRQKRLWLSHSGNVIVHLSCPAGGNRCSGIVRLYGKHRRLGAARYSIRAGHTKKVKVHLGRTAQHLVRRTHRLRVKVTTGGSHRTLVMRWSR